MDVLFVATYSLAERREYFKFILVELFVSIFIHLFNDKARLTTSMALGCHAVMITLRLLFVDNEEAPLGASLVKDPSFIFIVLLVTTRALLQDYLKATSLLLFGVLGRAL